LSQFLRFAARRSRIHYKAKYLRPNDIGPRGPICLGIGRGRVAPCRRAISFAKIRRSDEEKPSRISTPLVDYSLAPLKYTFRPDPEDMVAVNRMRFRPGKWIHTSAMIVLPLAVLATAAWKSGWIETDTLISLLAGLAFLPAYVIGLLTLKHLYFVPRKCRRIFSQTRNMHQQITVDINEGDLAVTSPSGSTSIRWQDLHAIKANDRVIALYQSEVQCIILPARVFNNAEERREALALIERRVNEASHP
jgi:hypothetical protein